MFYNNYGDYKMKDNKSYPEPSSFKSGNKVAWLYYHNLSDAKKASKLAVEKSKQSINFNTDNFFIKYHKFHIGILLLCGIQYRRKCFCFIVLKFSC